MKSIRRINSDSEKSVGSNNNAVNKLKRTNSNNTVNTLKKKNSNNSISRLKRTNGVGGGGGGGKKKEIYSGEKERISYV